MMALAALTGLGGETDVEPGDGDEAGGGVGE
jgi:hypothetical protein